MSEDIRRLIGQRLAVGFDGYVVPEEYRALVREFKIGNAILFRRNVKDFEQLKALCGDLRALIAGETGLEPFIMIDEECGSVSRLAHIAAPTPCAMAIGATGDPENAYRVGRLVGEELRAVGVNFNLAPDLDCFTNPDSSVIGNRSFAQEPEKAALFGARYARGLRDAGVIACGKHFPGHGDTAQDSHLDLPIVDKSADEVRRVELVPFQAAIDGGIDAIMSAHVVFPAFEPERVPSTVSCRVMTGLLRGEMGFRGLIVSDGMEMNAVMNLFGIEEATRRALAAGVDVALICHSAEQAASTMRHLLAAYDDGRLDPVEARESFERIAAKKARLLPATGDAAFFGSAAQKALARRIMEASVKVLHAPGGAALPVVDGETLFIGLPARAATLANDDVPLDAAALLADAFGARHGRIGGPEEAKVVVAVFTKHPEQALLAEQANRLAAAGASVIAVGMNTPRCLAGLSQDVWRLCAWQYDALAVDAVRQMLSGEARKG